MGGELRPARRGKQAARTEGRNAMEEPAPKGPACGMPGRAQKGAPPTATTEGRPKEAPPREERGDDRRRASAVSCHPIVPLGRDAHRAAGFGLAFCRDACRHEVAAALSGARPQNTPYPSCASTETQAAPRRLWLLPVPFPGYSLSGALAVARSATNKPVTGAERLGAAATLCMKKMRCASAAGARRSRAVPTAPLTSFR